MTEVPIQRPLGHNLNPSLQEFFQFQDQARRKPRTRLRSSLDQKIDIALRPGLASRNRAKDPDVIRAVFGSNAEDFFALLVEEFLRTQMT